MSLPRIPSAADGVARIGEVRRGSGRIQGADARESRRCHWAAGVWPAAAAEFARLFVVRRDHPHGPRPRRRRQSGPRDAAVAMVKPADAGRADHSAGVSCFDRSRNRRVPVQDQVRSVFVIVREVPRQEPSQVGLAQDDDVVEALSAHGSNHALRVWILPRSSRPDEHFLGIHRLDSTPENCTVDPIAIADQGLFQSRGKPESYPRRWGRLLL